MGTRRKRTGTSMGRGAPKSANEVFSNEENRDKFCMPLGLNSARDLEVCLQKEKDRK